jgi:hypothetical protein
MLLNLYLAQASAASGALVASKALEVWRNAGLYTGKWGREGKRGAERGGEGERGGGREGGGAEGRREGGRELLRK